MTVTIDRQLTGEEDSDRIVAASALAGYLQWFAEDVGAVSHRATEQIDAALTNTLHRIFSDTLQRVDKLNTRTLTTLAPVIKSGSVAKKFPCFQHNGCLCVRAENLTAYLQQATDNPSLTITDVTAELRQQYLLRMDKTGKSTRKVQGVRVLTIPLDKLK